nr:uncharacterized protein LOC121470045 [Taeniopygia guttata]
MRSLVVNTVGKGLWYHPSPTHDRTPPCQPEHGTATSSGSVNTCWDGDCTRSVGSIPVYNYLFCEEIPPDVQPEPPLAHEEKFYRLCSLVLALVAREKNPTLPGNALRELWSHTVPPEPPSLPAPSSLSRSPQHSRSRPFPSFLSLPWTHSSADRTPGQRDKARVRARFPSVMLSISEGSGISPRGAEAGAPPRHWNSAVLPGKGEPCSVCSSRSKITTYLPGRRTIPLSAPGFFSASNRY